MFNNDWKLFAALTQKNRELESLSHSSISRDIMGSTNAKPSRQRHRARTKPTSVTQASPQYHSCYVCGRNRSSRAFRLGPDQFICSGSNCGRIKYALEHALSRQPIIHIHHYEGDSSSKHIIEPKLKRNSQRQGNDAARNVWQPTKNTLINQTPPTESLVQSLTVGRSELVGDWKHRRSAIEA